MVTLLLSVLSAEVHLMITGSEFDANGFTTSATKLLSFLNKDIIFT